jgi:transcriptional regulator with XRE-family HTH domain
MYIGPMAVMTDDDVLELIRKRKGEKSLREFAKEIGITAPYLSDILKKNRSPGKTVLKFFGLEKKRIIQVSYEFNKKK